MAQEYFWQKGDVLMNDYRTFIFEGESALEKFDIYIDTVQKNTPERIEHSKTLPYMSGDYDMDKLIGYPTYGPRTIIYTCQIIRDNSTIIDDDITALENWLMGPVQGVLQDTGTPMYHYLAKCTNIVPVQDKDYAELTITFKAYPFKIMNYSVNELKWDDINFEHTVFVETEFEVTDSKTVTLTNRSSGPVGLNCTTDYLIGIKVDGITHQVSGSGPVPFLLLPGENVLDINVISSNLTATVIFDWVEELI